MKLFICIALALLGLHCDISRAHPTTRTTPSPVPEPATTCGYDSCHKLRDGMINVHIVPHTHDDVGWLKTVDQYYFGSKSDIQKAGVQYILDSVVDALKKDPSRRFIYVETAFFWKWWLKQHDIVKSQVRKFVNNGQLEFIGGAWSMNDEAVTHYQSIIDQFSWGLRKLNETFGECGRPKVGWQIDPFGHSREMASIFAQLGFDGLLLGRIDFQDKKFRFQSRTPEMIWQGSPDNLGRKAELFTSVMYNTYAPPPGFCFDVLCDDEPIIDDKRSADYNVDRRLKQFLEYIEHQAKAYPTEHLIVTMGGDFTYMDANMWYKNLDKLIRYANIQSNSSNVHLLYSTPSCYLKAVNEDAKKKNITFQAKADDFFPYASDPTAFWTGYFTSKPAIKRFERIGNNYLQVCKQLYALTNLGPEDWADINVMREAMGVMQHHDAITGTEKDHVAQDYARLLTKGFDECDIVMSTALSKLVAGKKQRQPRIDQEEWSQPQPEIDFNTCMLTNISQCEFTENQKEFVVTVYNPLSHDIDHFVRFPITEKGLEITGPDGEKVPVQIIPAHSAVLNIPGRTSGAKFDAIFKASNVPAMGFKSFYAKVTKENMVTKEETENNKLIKAQNILMKIDEATGKLFEITMNGKSIPFKNDFYYYHAAAGDNRKYETRSSGAYIFRPNGTLHNVVDVVKNTIYQGDLVTELHQVFNDWISQVVRVYIGVDHVEFEWLIGPIPIGDNFGKEVVAKYTTNLKTESTFYTDANGRELLKRVRDFRPSWKLNLTESISGNYYPVTSKILVRDPSDDVEVAVLTDRAQGGTSLQDGEIELMVHRRCLHDDAFGVDEALNETQFGEGLVIRGSHYVTLGSYIHEDGLAAYERELAQRKLLQAWTLLSSTMALSFADYKAKYAMKFSGLKQNLPKNVHILTLEPWKATSLLLRLEHFMEKNEDAQLSQPAKVNLQNLFTPFKILSFNETTLGANQWLAQNTRMQFKAGPIKNVEDFVDFYTSYADTTEEQEEKWRRGSKLYKNNQRETNDIKRPRKHEEFEYSVYDYVDDTFDVVLNPMEIRTFVIDIKMN